MPQPHTDLRKELSEILGKWNMPTRQAAINAILGLIDRAREEERENIARIVKADQEEIAIIQKQAREEVISTAIAKIEGMKNRPDNCIMNSARGRENTLLNKIISLLASFRDVKE
jgi:hypothetical protein